MPFFYLMWLYCVIKTDTLSSHSLENQAGSGPYEVFWKRWWWRCSVVSVCRSVFLVVRYFSLLVWADADWRDAWFGFRVEVARLHTCGMRWFVYTV